MSKNENNVEIQRQKDFADAANEQQPGFFGEFLEYLLNNKKWWITPILIFLLLASGLVMLGGTAAGPFVYSLF